VAEADARADLVARRLETDVGRIQQETAVATDPRALLDAEPLLEAAAAPGAAALTREGGSVPLPEGAAQAGWHGPFLLGETPVVSYPPIARRLTALVSSRALLPVLDSGPGCRPWILAPSGHFVAHRDRELMEGGATIFELAA